MIVDIARKYIGETEKPNNQGFNDTEFEKKMTAVGFKKGDAWCSLFSELCFKEAFPNNKDLDKLFSASAVETYKNFKAAGYNVSTKPSVGALMILQHYDKGVPGWQGHAGIVTEVIHDDQWKSVEGNTNDKGGREGYIVAEKFRSSKPKPDGLNLLGFIKIS